MLHQGTPDPAPAWTRPPYLAAQGLVKRFDDVTAVDRVDLGVQRNEIFALLGSSGCGKSTLLRMLAGLETPTSGRIVLDGEDITALPPYRRPTNMMFQSYALFPHMTVEDNIAFGLKEDRLPRPEVRRRVGEMLELVQMGKLARRLPHQLSGGQQQRAALARSLARHPKLLLLDEPLAALDKKIRQQTQLELAKVIRQVGVTCILVTHDQEEAMTMADRIGVMSEGRLLQVGTPTEIYEHPNCRFTADFIGDTNLFYGTLTSAEPGHGVVVAPDIDGEIVVQAPAGAAAGTGVWVSIRPERMELRREAPEGGVNGSIGTLRDVAYLGGTSVLHIELPTSRVVKAAVPATHWGHGRAPAAGETVFVGWDAAACVVLTS